MILNVLMIIGLGTSPAAAPPQVMDEASLSIPLPRPSSPVLPLRIDLAAGWSLQSSAKVTAAGPAISSPGFAADGWYATTVPSTVVAALVAAGVYADPYFGMNLRAIPGTSYPIGAQFSNLPMPDDSPFRVSWWYRTEFSLPAGTPGRRVALHFDGITYRANIWLNGRQIAKRDQVAGTWRAYEFDVTDLVKPGANALAVEVFAPEQKALALTWVDWNPSPPDKDMGLWRPVYVTTSGPVALRRPYVETKLGAAGRAALTVSVDVANLTAGPVRGRLRARLADTAVTQELALGPHQTRTVLLGPEKYPQLNLANARLWWPAEMGTPSLYRLDVSVETAAGISDRDSLRFGIREITSELAPSGGRVFRVNGRRILVRGGGWAPDMMLRASPQRELAELQYVLDMHLNTVRLEGKLEDDRFFDLADSLGVLVMAGWCCCDHWEHWKDWTAEDHQIAEQSQRTQIARLRAHPSLLMWLNGSDNPPPPDVERMYLHVLQELRWPNPVVSSATQRPTSVTGASGVKMTGPYDWVPPSYWLLDTTRGGAHGFNTETSPGPAVPPVESLRRMLPADHLWPPDEFWSYHAGGGEFTNVKIFSDALAARYGAASNVEDFAQKSQLMAYEGERAMFEGFARNRYRSTGVIQWMLNNAWPSLIWHLYDYYLRPGGGYFGAKKGAEPLHALYAYNDRSIAVANHGDAARGVALRVRVFDLSSATRFAQDTVLDLPADSSVRILTLPEPAGWSPTYFLDLRLTGADGRVLSTNFYWLSTKTDDLDFPKSTWYVTPTRSYADYTALGTLPAAQVTATVRFEQDGPDELAHVTLSNPGSTLAFFLRLQVVAASSGEEVLPVRWTDNYLSLPPGESREVTARYRSEGAPGTARGVVVSGWNVARATVP